MAIMMLVEEGELQLQDSISKFFPEAPIRSGICGSRNSDPQSYGNVLWRLPARTNLPTFGNDENACDQYDGRLKQPAPK